MGCGQTISYMKLRRTSYKDGNQLSRNFWLFYLVSVPVVTLSDDVHPPPFVYATATLLGLHVHRGFLSKTLRGVPQKVVITFGPFYPKFCIGSFCSNSSRWSDFEKKCKIIILSTRTSHKKWLGRGKVTKRWWWSYKSNDTYLNHCLISFVYLIRDIFVNQKKAYSSRRKYKVEKKKLLLDTGRKRKNDSGKPSIIIEKLTADCEVISVEGPCWELKFLVLVPQLKSS